MDLFVALSYMATSFLAHLFAVIGLFKIEPILGLAGLFYEASTWFKVWGEARLKREIELEELNKKNL